MKTTTRTFRYRRRRLLCAIAAIFVFSLWSAPDAHAQEPDRDGDGTLDRSDRCPDVPGPADNYGCPYPDRDGDGTPDQSDRCPDQPGPADNGGCPREEDPPPAPGGDPGSPPPGSDSPPPESDQLPPDPDLPSGVVLPALPDDGPCVVATQGTEGVNIRALPSTAFGIIIVGGMDPELLYPALMSVQTPEGVWWWLKQGGFVAGWVTRQGGDCSLLPFVELTLAEDHFVFHGHSLLDPDQPGVFPLLVFFDTTGAVKEAWFVGFGNPGEESGFDPQPDPPGDDAGIAPPDPDQPPPFFLMLSAQEDIPPDPGAPSSDEAGIIIIGGIPSGDEGGLVINWIPSGDEAGIIIDWIPSGDEAGIIVNWIPSGDEAGLVINWTPSGDESGIIIEWLIGDSGIIIDFVPGDGSVMPGGESAFCDGSVMPGDGTLRPMESMMGDGSVMPGDVAVMFCDGSVKPMESLAGDGSVIPPPTSDSSEMSSWLLPAMVFPGGGGEEMGCSNNLLPLPDMELGGPDTSPTATCAFTNGELLALCGVSSEEAFCAYSEF